MKHKIYAFNNGGGRLGISVQALADTGEVLAGHFSSNEGWGKHDIGIGSDRKHDLYDKAFPEGWEIEWVERRDIDTHEGFQKALAANALLKPTE
jgi:hypothetical protein